MKDADLGGICRNLANALEPVVFEDYPQVKEIKETSLRAGGLGSLMSGSGPTVFTLAGSQDHAIRISKALEGLGPAIITGPARMGVEIKEN